LHQHEDAIIDNCIAPIELNCKFEDEQPLIDDKSSESGFTCKAQSIKIDYPKTKILKIIGNDEEIKKVSVFTSIDQSLKFLPYELAKNFANLRKIIVERSKLTALHKTDFSGFSNLKRIEIRHNNLSLIENGTFDDVTQLEHLDLSYNNIQSLPARIFMKLIHIKSLILSHNQIESFTADLLPRKNAIEVVLIDNNQLEIIETKTLRFLRKTKLIDLTGNVCIDLKFDKADKSSKSLVELSGEIDLNCSSDDL
jgi:Leucine-rich repeat (LRR) protein